MCGIVAIISKSHKGFWPNDIKIFEQLLWADQLRGQHGTGIFYNSNDNKSIVRKMPTTASMFLGSKNYPKIADEIYKNSTFLVGHNRHATKGGKTQDDTHPFKEGNITLVHNGTLNSHKNLHDTVIDSHAICHSINKIGYEETLKKVDGAFALVWFDEYTKKLHFCRNFQRPLNILETKNVWILCSEMKLAEWICDRNNTPITKKTVVVTNVLYTLDTQAKDLEIKESPLIYKSYTYEKTDEHYEWNYYKGSQNYKGYPHNGGSHNVNNNKQTPLLLDNKSLPPKDTPGITTKKNKEHIKLVSKSDIIGKRISFIPISVRSLVKDVYFMEGITEDPKTGIEHDIRMYGSRAELIQWQEARSILGTVTAEGWERDIGHYYILRSPEEGALTHNGLAISKEQLKDVPGLCTCCACGISHDLLDIPSQHIEWNPKKIKYDIFCPDCTEHIDDAENASKEIIQQANCGC